MHSLHASITTFFFQAPKLLEMDQRLLDDCDVGGRDANRGVDGGREMEKRLTRATIVASVVLGVASSWKRGERTPILGSNLLYVIPRPPLDFRSSSFFALFPHFSSLSPFLNFTHQIILCQRYLPYLHPIQKVTHQKKWPKRGENKNFPNATFLLSPRPQR